MALRSHRYCKMPASLRLEIFPKDLNICISFYTSILRFTLLRHEPEMGYAYMSRDAIKIGAVASNHFLALPTHQKKSGLDPGSAEIDVRHRFPPTGVEIVLEVDDVEEEQEWVSGWERLGTG